MAFSCERGTPVHMHLEERGGGGGTELLSEPRGSAGNSDADVTKCTTKGPEVDCVASNLQRLSIVIQHRGEFMLTAVRDSVGEQ